MGAKDIKALRGQVRMIVKEMLPEILNAELVRVIEQRLAQGLNTELTKIASTVKTTLDQVDQRSKDTQNYVVRNVGVPQAPSTAQPVIDTQANANRNDASLG